jgi:hypothetical protein
MEGDTNDGEGVIYLYKVIDRETISRDKVKSLWREGKVSGLFNLPTEELFDACRDFGVKVDISTGPIYAPHLFNYFRFNN